MHPVYEYDVALLEEKLRNGKIILKELCERHKAQPGMHLLRHIR